MPGGGTGFLFPGASEGKALSFTSPNCALVCHVGIIPVRYRGLRSDDDGLPSMSVLDDVQ